MAKSLNIKAVCHEPPHTCARLYTKQARDTSNKKPSGQRKRILITQARGQFERDFNVF